MDKRMLGKLTQSKERLDDVMQLKKEGKKDPSKYDEIFEKYGQTIYNLAVPSKHRKAEIKKLMAEGRFEDIYRKHGRSAYNDNIYKMQQADVYNETGSKPRSAINRIKNVIKHRIAPVFLSTLMLTPPAIGTVWDVGLKEDMAKTAIEYAKEIEEFDTDVANYAEVVNNMDLSHLEIFMKTMYDLWERIDGYDEKPYNDKSGYFRLTLLEENRGVCRHFADDMAARLNAINPEYNARIVAVYMDDNDYSKANIQRKIFDSNPTVTPGDSQNDEEKENASGNSEFLEFFQKINGNHAVTAVDIPGENVTLILDPTNVSIGVFKDGQIQMFSTPDGKGLEAKTFGHFAMCGFDETVKLKQTELASFLVSDKTVEELKTEYGIPAQNKALERLAVLRGETDYSSKNFYDIRVTDQDVLNRIREEEQKAAKQAEQPRQADIEKDERTVE